MSKDIIGLNALISQRVLNAKTLADMLYDSIMDENCISDVPLSLTIMLQEQLKFLGDLVDGVEEMEEGGRND